ncbi:FAD-dependent monooxygenase [Williamsia sp. CHRR-6]|uniref:FAD-dependent monooxygenase n=1 Tax=Williamsia sp. CHRR-6 TaxID=2835871 RepID=UPI001BDAB815|nr:FAD-dependent monooxygenase [Williamsia sp. CHRR-6]MBT0565404.1 FAD-dependent monooxygenase [Williamsia sp. CHRR-6]
MTKSQSTRKVLVVGLGVSGIATAIRLLQAGWSPVIVEKASKRRDGGYFIAMFGSGRSAADRLGILDGVHDRGNIGVHLDIDRQGGRSRGLAYTALPGEPWQMVRGDVEEAAWAKLPADVEVRFSTVPTDIRQDADGVDVDLHNTADDTRVTERFDLVVGADGLRSTVRRLAFGPHEKYLHRLNHIIAAFEFPGTPKGLKKGEGAALIEVGRSMWLFAFADHNPTVLFSYETSDVDAEFTHRPADRIREVFGPQPLGETLTDAIAAMEKAGDDVLFDSVEQVKMDRWHNNRVVLVGDAAWCVTLYAGMGVSAGITGAVLLGDALERHPDNMDRALEVWEQTMRPTIDFYQEHALVQRPFFTPHTYKELGDRSLATKLLFLPVVGWLLRRSPWVRAADKRKDSEISLPPLPKALHGDSERDATRADLVAS